MRPAICEFGVRALGRGDLLDLFQFRSQPATFAVIKSFVVASSSSSAATTATVVGQKRCRHAAVRNATPAGAMRCGDI